MKTDRQGRGVRPFTYLILLLIVCIGLTAVQPARAADTGEKVTTNVVSAGSNWVSFQVSSLDSSDDDRAENSTSNDWGVINNFSFNVPSAAQIDGIQVDVEGSRQWSLFGSNPTYAVQLSWDNGSSWTSSKTDSFTSGADATDTLGGSSDLWGRSSWSASELSDANFQLRIARTAGSRKLRIDLIEVTVYYSEPSFTWATGSADFQIYASSSLTWDAGTLVCSGTLTDTNGDTITCSSGAIANSTQYRVQVELDNTGDADATMASGDYVDHVAVKGGWAGTSPTLGNCAFNDIDTDNTSATCSAAWNATNNVRITNTGTEVKIASTTGSEGFSYLITTDSDVPAADTASYMNTSIDTYTEDSSKISITGPTAPAPTWATGSADFEIYESSSLTWDAGTLVCSGTLSDNNASTISCDSDEIKNSTQYRVQVVLENIGSADATMASGDYVDHVAVKSGWAGTSPTLGSCAFNDLDGDNSSASCSAAWNDTNDVRITTSSGTVTIAYSDTNNAEGFSYLITTDSDVPSSDATSYMDTSIDSVTQDSSKITIKGPTPDLTWSTGSADFMIYESSSLTWDAGTVVCGGILTDTNGDIKDCNGFTLDNSTQYRVQMVLKNTGTTDASMASGDFVDHVAVKGGWGGTSPTLGSCAFYDQDSDNTSATCSAAWNDTYNVRITNTGTEVKIANSDTNNAEGFMYLITTDSDVPASDAASYLNASIDSVTEDSSKIRIGGPTSTIQDTNTSGETSNTTSHTVSLPANVSGGDLLMVFFACDGAPTVTWPTGWSSDFSQANGTANTLSIGYKIADGTEGSTITVTTGAGEQSAHISYRITGHDSETDPEFSSGATGNSDNPDPDSLTPTGGAKDYLWIAVEGNDDNDGATGSGYPGSYEDGLTNPVEGGFWGGASVSVAKRERNASSENPGTFTIVAGEEWVACTVAVHPQTEATAVSLVSFTARGTGAGAKVAWQTGSEHDNLGFHLYRATAPAGPYERLTDKLISATVEPGKGGTYSYLDTEAAVGSLYYYKLEDIDIYGKRTQHGPIGVDWDADGMPDDWEITHGLNPWVDDADDDYDGDGLSNFEEYERDLNPFNMDSDGDGIPDGEEDGRLPERDDRAARSIGRGVEVLAHDDSGMSIALNTSGFEAQVVTVGAQEYEQLSIADYVHGYTTEVGAPQLPLKGLLIDVPAGKAARLSVVDSRMQPYSGYQIYPAPEAVVDATGGVAAVGSAFVQDDLAYSSDGFYPQVIAALGERYLFRDQSKQQVIFYPIGFNPASGQLNVYQRIELRIDFVDADDDALMAAVPAPWQVPDARPGVLSSLAVGLAAAPTLVNPLSPLLSSMGAAVAALWSPEDATAGDVFKIMTDTEGIHQITKGFLDTYGVDTNAIRLSQVRLYYLGQEVAIEVFDQNGDDLMDADDTIHFYASPISPNYVKYSRENVYWLTLSVGAGSPLRMAGIDGSPSGGQVAADFAHSSHHEQQMLYSLKAPGPDSLQRWFYLPLVPGDAHSGGGQPVSFTLTVPHPTSSGNLTVSMLGQTNTYHQVRVAINGVEQDFSWYGINYYEAVVEDVPLVDGDNTVTLQCLSFDGNDVILVDWFNVHYWRDYVAVDNMLTFSPDSGSRYVVDGFSSNSLLAYDISNPAAVARIENAVIAGADPYAIDLRPQVAGDRYLVIAADAVNSPVGMVQDTAANLAAAANGADYILVTHRDVGWDANGNQHSWLTDLAAHREAQGLRVFVADIEDIYDTFSFGLKSPQALKDFLAYAYNNWTPPAPAYVVLVGDSTYDPNDYWNMADATAYLPTYLTHTDYKGETVSDQWFVTFSGEDAVADMHIGRLPAADAAQAAVMVAKIIAYETSFNEGTWTSNTLLVADDQRPGETFAYEADFEAMNEAVAHLVPTSMADPFKGYLNEYTQPAYLTDYMIDTLNNGVLMLNYAGHGATQVWAFENIFKVADVAALTNSDKLTFFVSMSCEAGFFAYPENWFNPSLAEALLRSEAGAVAALMPTGMTSTSGHQILDTALFEAIFTKDIRTLGPAIADAKQTLLANGDGSYAQVADTFTLFGDPATVLNVPLPRIPTGITANLANEEITISWDSVSDCNKKPVAGYNIYRASSPKGPFKKINKQMITDTGFADSDTTAVMAASSGGGSGGSYYVVSAVDESGFESVPSFAVKPAAVPEVPEEPEVDLAPVESSSAAGGGGGGCFISTAQPAAPLPWMLWVLLMFIGVVWAWRKVYGPRHKEKDCG